jgi:hypothetical protein
MPTATASASVSLLDFLSERQAQAEDARGCHLAAVLDTNSMAYWLSLACRQAREAAGRLQVHVAASHDRGVNQSTIARFEDAVAWPKNPDQIVAAYADDLDISPMDIWDLALSLWKRHQAGEALEALSETAAARAQRAGMKPRPRRNGRAPRRTR